MLGDNRKERQKEPLRWDQVDRHAKPDEDAREANTQWVKNKPSHSS